MTPIVSRDGLPQREHPEDKRASSLDTTAAPANAGSNVLSTPASGDLSSLGGLTHALGLEPAATDGDPIVGLEIGGVRILRLIAAGGMGRVYEGREHETDRLVALKVMRPGLMAKKGLRRFEKEVALLGRLRHPGIAQVFSSGTCHVAGSSVPYFVMEYIADAKPITHFVTHHVLSLAKRVHIFRKVCEAVAHGHDEGVIHRDLKPGNVLVEPSGNPKVIDFGIARGGDAGHDVSSLTETGQLIGTVQYMSPEQVVADHANIDARSDVYSLGLILFEILTGSLPYVVPAKNPFQAAEIVLRRKPPHPSTLNPDISPVLERIVGTCLAKDRKRRYADAGHLVDALNAVLRKKSSS